jgi:hypothetical protein
MFVDKKNYKDASNEDTFKVELFIDKSTGQLVYRNSIGQKVIINTFMEEEYLKPKDPSQAIRG